MKKKEKLRLSVQSEQTLAEKEMGSLKGGNFCCCSCYWEGNTGSSIADNRHANWELGIISRHGENCYWESDTSSGTGCPCGYDWD